MAEVNVIFFSDCTDKSLTIYLIYLTFVFQGTSSWFYFSWCAAVGVVTRDVADSVLEGPAVLVHCLAARHIPEFQCAVCAGSRGALL